MSETAPQTSHRLDGDRLALSRYMNGTGAPQLTTRELHALLDGLADNARREALLPDGVSIPGDVLDETFPAVVLAEGEAPPRPFDVVFDEVAANNGDAVGSDAALATGLWTNVYRLSRLMRGETLHTGDGDPMPAGLVDFRINDLKGDVAGVVQELATGFAGQTMVLRPRAGGDSSTFKLGEPVLDERTGIPIIPGLNADSEPVMLNIPAIGVDLDIEAIGPISFAGIKD